MSQTTKIPWHAKPMLRHLPIWEFPRDIWLICISNVIGAFGEGLYFWVFPIYVRSLQADYVQLGLVFSALYGASALMPIPGGLLADRFDRKKILIFAWTPWVLSPLFYSLATNWAQLIPGAVCWGISMVGVPAANAYIITSMNDRRRLASAISLVWSSYSLSYVFAPAAGGYLATIVGMRTVFHISTLLIAVATAVFFFLSSQHPPKTNPKISKPINPSDHKGQLRRVMLFWAVFFMIASFFISITRLFIQTFLSEEIKLGEFYIGIFGSFHYAGITVLGIIIGYLGDREKKSNAIALCLLCYTLAIAPLTWIWEIPLLMTFAFLLGGSWVTGAIVNAFIGTNAPENRRGLWVSIPQTLGLAAAFIASYVGGYLYSISPYHVFAVSLAAMPFLILLALTKLKEE
ncbi:MFS transporter [Candidatus Bathyarchaeota archaeon]|nr:MFS transporter [Candidatus Bathyarchaeota archaeon]